MTISTQTFRLNDLFNDNMEKFYEALRGPDELMEFARWRREQSRKVEVPMFLNRVPEDVARIVLTPETSRAPEWADIIMHGRSPFFNESRWFNEGIKFALAQDSKWIVLMSDDLYEVSPIQCLSEHLSKLDNTEFDTVWIDPWPDYYHSYTAYLAERHPLESVLGPSHWRLDTLFKKFDIETVIGSVNPIRKPLHYHYFHKMFPRPQKSETFKMSGDFVILSAEWCRKQGPEVLSEMFCGWEDLDLSQRLLRARSTTVNWRIGSSIGGTLGVGFPKALRELYNLSIFNSFLREARYG